MLSSLVSLIPVAFERATGTEAAMIHEARLRAVVDGSPLALVGIGSGWAYVNYRFNQVQKVTVKHLRAAPVGSPFNVLLIGSDSRVGESAAEATHFGSESETGGQRSDVVKIVHIVPATGQVSVLSIPRDTMVTVAGDTSETGQYNRINATYNSGPDQLVQTIEADFGIPIEHVVQIDFTGLEGAVDAIGGIYLNFPYPAKDAYTGLQITQTGCQLVNGGYSLALARSRHYEYYKDGYWQSDPTSDLGRIQRQNLVISAVLDKAKSTYNPLELNSLLSSVVHDFTKDNNLTAGDLFGLAERYHAFGGNSLNTFVLPTEGAVSSYAGDVEVVQPEEASAMISQFLGGPLGTITTPPIDAYGNALTLATPTTTTTTAPVATTAPPATSSTATTAPVNSATASAPSFDPTPC